MRINVSLPDELAAKVDRDRGDVSRSMFIRRAVEMKVGLRDVGAEQSAKRKADGVVLDPAIDRVEVTAQARVAPDPPPDSVVASGLRQFKCECVTSATSDKARCRKHNRGFS